MDKIIVATHKTYGKGLIESAKRLTGESLESFVFVGLEENDGIEDFVKKLSDLGYKDVFACFTDLVGGSPSRACLEFFWDSTNIPIITGVNLPMVLESTSLCKKEDISIADFISKVKSVGRNSIKICEN